MSKFEKVWSWLVLIALGSIYPLVFMWWFIDEGLHWFLNWNESPVIFRMVVWVFGILFGFLGSLYFAIYFKKIVKWVIIAPILIVSTLFVYIGLFYYKLASTEEK